MLDWELPERVLLGVNLSVAMIWKFAIAQKKVFPAKPEIPPDEKAEVL